MRLNQSAPLSRPRAIAANHDVDDQTAEHPVLSWGVRADALSFAETAEIPVVPMPIEWEPGSAARIEAVCKANGIVMLGERHGIAENASLIFALLERFSIGALALEWLPSYRPALDVYVAGGELDLEPFSQSADGTVTPQHFSLLRDTLRTGRVNELALVDDYSLDDGDGFSQNRRDRWMARSLLAQWSQRQPILLVAGGLHAIRTPITLDGEDRSPLAMVFDGADVLERQIVPTGAVLADEVERTTTCWTEWLSGAFSNYGRKDLGEPIAAGPAKASIVPEPTDLMWAAGDALLQIPVATAALVPAPGLTLPDLA